MAAFKEFALADNPQRYVQAGKPYCLPLPPMVSTLPEQPPGPVLELFAAARAQQTARTGNERVAARRRVLTKRLAQREVRLQNELASLYQKRSQAHERDGLRAEGDAIFATLHELGRGRRDEAKERAAGALRTVQEALEEPSALGART